MNLRSTIGKVALTRRDMLRHGSSLGVFSGLATGCNPNEAQGNASASRRRLKVFTCDLNWCLSPTKTPSAPQDWAFINPQEYFRWHRELGVNMFFCHAYTSSGYALYESAFGAVAAADGRKVFPTLFALSEKAGMPFMAYFSVGWDMITSTLRNEWVLPGSRQYNYFGALAPESPWTDLLCKRIRELLRLHRVQWILFDMFLYGKVFSEDFPLLPTTFNKKIFPGIIGRPMPERPSEILAEEALLYKRTVLANQYYRIRETVAKVSPDTKLCFNVPYVRPDEPMWIGHPMVNESDMLFAESTDGVVDWLLRIRKPHQRVMTTIIGREGGLSNPNTWKRWSDLGCDFFGYAFGTPPDFRPTPFYEQDLKVVRRAYAQI